MNTQRFYIACSLLATVGTLSFTACSQDDSVEPSEGEKPGKMPVAIVTRTTGEQTNVNAGLFMVNYLDDAPDELLASGNYIHNQLLTLSNGTWNTSTPIYWYDMQTAADFYAYAPYQTTVPDARQLTFSVAADQRSQEQFEESDFLWGCVMGKKPADGSFSLQLSHMLSRLSVSITAGNGFAEGELKDNDISVSIGGTKPRAFIDLKDGSVTTVTNAQPSDIACHAEGNLVYSAILIPQYVPFSNFIKVVWKGNTYILQNSFTLEPKKQYQLTVQLKKTASGFDIGIEGWDIIPEDFGGIVG